MKSKYSRENCKNLHNNLEKVHLHRIFEVRDKKKKKWLKKLFPKKTKGIIDKEGKSVKTNTNRKEIVKVYK